MRKFIVILLTVLLTLPQLTFAKDMDQELEEVILKVKNNIEVPKEFTQFSYDISAEGIDTTEKKFYIQWHDEKSKVGSVNVEVDEKGNILRYYTHDYVNYFKGKETTEIKISCDEGLKIAKTFINKMLKNAQGEIREGDYIRPNQEDTYTYIFEEYVEGVKVYQMGARVEVNKFSGEVVSFSSFEPFKGIYEKKEKVISLEEAQKAYLEKIGLKVVHEIDKNYDTKTINTFPAYVTNDISNQGINAITGETIEIFDNQHRPMRNESKDSMVEMSQGGDEKLTAEEEKAVSEMSGLITSEETVTRASKYFPSMVSTTVDNVYLSKNSYNESYEWNIQLSGIDKSQIEGIFTEEVTSMMDSEDKVNMLENYRVYIDIVADAKTGEVLSYNISLGENIEEKGITYEAARKKVESFLQSIEPHKYKEVKADTQLNIEENSEDKRYTFYYNRMVKGVPVTNNGFLVTYDSVKQEVVAYFNIWDLLKFQDMGKIVSKDEIVKKIGLELMYISKDKDTRVLAYITPDNTIAFDPITGNRINAYNGKPYVNQSMRIVYDDIAGHKMEGIIKKLSDRGIQLEGKSFKPESKISQIDFMRMLMGQTEDQITDEVVYDYVIREGILSKEDIQKDKPVTGIEAIRYSINKLGYNQVAQLQGIYVLPFKENTTIEEEAKGYVALAYGLGIINSEDLKYIIENTTLSRAQSADMIYKVLTK